MFGDADKTAALILGAPVEGGSGDGAAPVPGDDEATDPGADEGLKAAGADLITAVHAKDSAGVVAAMRAAFEMLQSQPPSDDEGPEE